MATGVSVSLRLKQKQQAKSFLEPTHTKRTSISVSRSRHLTKMRMYAGRSSSREETVFLYEGVC